MIMLRKMACALSALLIGGCSTYTDQSISRTKAAGSVLGSETSYFCQHASYATNDSVYRGGQVLSHLLGFWTAQQVALVRFKPLSENEFSTEYLDKNLKVVDSRHYVRGVDYQVESDGTLDIKTSSRCAGGDSPGLGCTWSKIRLFTDPTGRLAVIQETGGAGIAGIVPVASSSKYLSLFPPIAFSDGSLPENLARCPESRASKVEAEMKRQKVEPTFVVGDVIVPYRRYDPARKEVMLGPREDLEGTKWRVKDISGQYVRVELIEGEYKPRYLNGVVHRAGAYSTQFGSSDGYKAAKPYAGDHGQVFEEFRKDD